MSRHTETGRGRGAQLSTRQLVSRRNFYLHSWENQNQEIALSRQLPLLPILDEVINSKEVVVKLFRSGLQNQLEEKPLVREWFRAAADH